MGVSQESVEQLRRIATIVDPKLANLSPHALIDTLLEQVRKLLVADTVTVLVTDAVTRQLETLASRGTRATSQRTLQIPLTSYFGRRLIADDSPVFIERVDAESIADTGLAESRVASLVAVPLVASGNTIGAIIVCSDAPRRFDGDDAILLQHAAERIAMAIATQQVTDDRLAARTLQRSLLPTHLPTIDGLEFAARFLPAETFGVGGDWYDAFTLPSGHVAIVVGDIAGSGLRAAVVMGRMRSALRAYAIESPGPAETLTRLNTKFDHFEPNQMATVLYLLIEPSLTRLTVASAGHLPPVIATPDGTTRFIDVPPGPPIGAHTGKPHTDHTVDLPLDGTIACYTDGLIERRREQLDTGLERLRSSHRTGPVEEVCDAIMSSLTESNEIEDDTMLFVFRRIERTGSAEERVPTLSA